MGERKLFRSFLWGEENFLEEAFLPPTPPIFQEPWRKGIIFLCLFVRLSVERTNPSLKVFVHLFQKVVQSRAKSPCRPSQRAKFSLILPKTQERVNFFALQRKRENPRRGFSLFSNYGFSWGKGNFLKKAFLPPHPYLSKTFKRVIFWVVIVNLCARRNFCV